MSEMKVSILMPVYNEENYIEETINTILNQEYKNFELIVVNDQSTDNTLNILNKYKDYKNIKVFTNDKKGKNFAFNKAFAESTGNWFVYWGGDDNMPVNSISARMNLVKSYNPKIDKVCSSGRLRSFSTDKNFDSIIVPKSSKKMVITGGTILFSKSIANIIFPIPTNLPNEDMWSGEVIKKFSNHLLHTSEVVINYRIHANNSQSRYESFDEKNVSLHKRYKFYEHFKEKFGTKLSYEQIREIEAAIKAEEYRYNGELMKILLLKNVKFLNKLRLLAFGNKKLYNLRMKYYRQFSGW